MASDAVIWPATSSMTAAFWSRFKRFLLSRSYGCRGSLEESVARGLCGGALRLNKIAGAARVDLHARAHGRGHDDGADVLALGRGRLRADELLDDRLVVLEQLPVLERGLAR